MSDWIDVSESGESWDGKKPLQGTYTNKKTDVGPNDSNMYMVKTKDGLMGVWGSTVLDNKFEQIPTGSEVKIEYLGKEKSKTGTEYKNYKVQYKPTAVNEVFGGVEVE